MSARTMRCSYDALPGKCFRRGSREMIEAADALGRLLGDVLDAGQQPGEVRRRGFREGAQRGGRRAPHGPVLAVEVRRDDLRIPCGLLSRQLVRSEVEGARPRTMGTGAGRGRDAGGQWDGEEEDEGDRSTGWRCGRTNHDEAEKDADVEGGGRGRRRGRRRCPAQRPPCAAQTGAPRQGGRLAPRSTRGTAATGPSTVDVGKICRPVGDRRGMHGAQAGMKEGKDLPWAEVAQLLTVALPGGKSES